MASIKESRCPRNPSIPPVSDRIKPGESFYKYVNEVWLKSHHVKPWQGEFDSETLTRPIYEGKPVLPGIRNCGHSDCVNPEHIKKA